MLVSGKDGEKDRGSALGRDKRKRRRDKGEKEGRVGGEVGGRWEEERKGVREGRVKVGGRREKERREREKKKVEGLIKLY